MFNATEIGHQTELVDEFTELPVHNEDDPVEKIMAPVSKAKRISGQQAAIQTASEYKSDIENLSEPDWNRIKPQLKECINLSSKELEALRQKQKRQTNAGWMAELEFDINGNIKSSLKNIKNILEKHPALRGRIRYNQLLQRACLSTDLPIFEADEHKGIAYVPLEDQYISRLRTWIACNLAEFRPDKLSDAIITVASLNIFNPLVDILESCGREWDQKPRLDHWLETYCNAQLFHTDAISADQQRAYLRKVGLLWMISAVARAIAPGCKVDNMLIIEGPQGSLKSTFVRVLAFSFSLELTTSINSSKEVVAEMIGKWIVELPELKALSKDEEVNKAFLSKLTDNERLSYERYARDMPRRCVFIGTTNQAEFLKDVSGNRRYWPVMIGRCDIEALKKDLRQLWGEAVVRYHQGEKWFLDPLIIEDNKIIRVAEKIQDIKKTEDPWTSIIANGLADHEGFTTTGEVYQKYLNGKIDRLDRSVQMRITDILKSLGYTKDSTVVDGKKTRGWII